MEHKSETLIAIILASFIFIKIKQIFESDKGLGTNIEIYSHKIPHPDIPDMLIATPFIIVIKEIAIWNIFLNS